MKTLLNQSLIALFALLAITSIPACSSPDACYSSPACSTDSPLEDVSCVPCQNTWTDLIEANICNQTAPNHLVCINPTPGGVEMNIVVGRVNGDPLIIDTFVCGEWTGSSAQIETVNQLRPYSSDECQIELHGSGPFQVFDTRAWLCAYEC